MVGRPASRATSSTRPACPASSTRSFGHWVWGPGWLARQTPWVGFNGISPNAVFRDFAGSTVVHTVGGFIALGGAIVLGPRLGRKFKRDGGGAPAAPTTLTMGAIGGVILWFGWYGFNHGSTPVGPWTGKGIGGLPPTPPSRPAAAGIWWPCSSPIRGPRPGTSGISVNGFLGGLSSPSPKPPAIGCRRSAPSASVRWPGSWWPLGIELLEYLRIDDPIGAWPVQTASPGSRGTLSLGLFATGTLRDPDPGRRRHLHDGKRPLSTEAAPISSKRSSSASLTCVVVVSAVTLLIMFAIHKIKGQLDLADPPKMGELERNGHPRARHARLPHGVRHGA